MRDFRLQSNSINSSARILIVIFWLILASIGGLFIATQSPAIIIIAASIITFTILAAITPLAAVTVLLVLAPMRTLIATEASFQLPLDIGQIALIGLIIAWFSQRVARNESVVQTFRNPVSLVIVMYLVVIGFTAFGSTSLSAWLNEWIKWLQILLLITFALNYGGERRWEWLLFALTISAVANALVGIYEFFGGSGALHLLINDKYFRAFGTFGQPNPFGGFMGLVAPITLMAALGYGKRYWERWKVTYQLSAAQRELFFMLFYSAATIIILIGIIMSWSRGAWIGLVGAFLIVALALPRNTWRGIALFVAILGIVVLLWFAGIVPRSVIDRLSTSTQEFFAFEDVRSIDITPENYAVAERLAHWQAAINMFTDNPWLGVGLGNYEVVYSKFRLINWQESLGHAHNYYLNLLAEGGIIGLLAYGKVWIVIILLCWRGRSHPDMLARCIIIGLMGSLLYLAIHSFFDNLYVNNLFLHIGLMFGMVAVLYNQSRSFIRLGIS